MTKNEYRMLHHFIQKQKGKASFCVRDRSHTSKRFEWANISGEYRWDVNDFESLCIACHRAQDFKEITRERMRVSHLGKISPRRKKVQQEDLDGVIIGTYPSLTEASEKTNILISSICNALRGASTMAGGYKWKFL